MEQLLKERFDRLESALRAIRLETVATPGHSDPGALVDCWLTVDEYVHGIKSKVRQLLFDAWVISNRKARGENVDDFDSFLKRFHLDELHYLKEDNNNTHWNNTATYVKDNTMEKSYYPLRAGKELGAIITDKPIGGGPVDENEVQDYGGYLVAESIRSKELSDQIIAAYNDKYAPKQKEKENGAHSFTEGMDFEREIWDKPTLDQQIDWLTRQRDKFSSRPKTSVYQAIIDSLQSIKRLPHHNVDVVKVIEDLVQSLKSIRAIQGWENAVYDAYIQNAEAALGMLQAFKKDGTASSHEQRRFIQRANIVRVLSERMQCHPDDGSVIVDAIEKLIKLHTP